MPSSMHEAATVEDVARSAHKLAREALEHGMRANRRLDEMEHANARTIESMKGIFANVVEEHSAKTAERLDAHTKSVESLATSVAALVRVQAAASEDIADIRTSQKTRYRNDRVVMVVVALILGLQVRACPKEDHASSRPVSGVVPSEPGGVDGARVPDRPERDHLPLR